MKDLITEARELCERAEILVNELHTERIDYNTEYLPLIDAIQTIPELCDALERAEAEIEKMKPFYTIADDTFKHWENAAYAMRDDERKKHRWIPVTERLPEIDVAVLVLHTYQRDEYSPITIGRLYQPCDKRRNPYWTFVSIQASDGAVYNDGTDFICPGSEYVTHWMPLPAPPEEGGTT